LPSSTREAHKKEADRIRKQKELDALELLARQEREIDQIIDISSGDEAVSAQPKAGTTHTGVSEFAPLVCTVASDRLVVNLDEELVSKLKSHQLEGVKFMWGHLSNADGFGCVLADEMGLGKTLTTLVTLHALSLANVCKHALVVCPSLVISTWIEQTEKWLPSTSCISRLCVISPEVPPAKRLGKMRAWSEEGGLCVIGYEMFREVCSQPDSPSAVLLTATPNVVIVDEGDAAA
jgi:SNF2 family DNA or RNA helicase